MIVHHGIAFSGLDLSNPIVVDYVSDTCELAILSNVNGYGGFFMRRLMYILWIRVLVEVSLVFFAVMVCQCVYLLLDLIFV